MGFADHTPPGSRFVIEAATWRDLNALRALEQECFPQDAWPLWDLVWVLTMGNVVRLKAVAEGRMVGFIAGDHRSGQDAAWIVTVGVLTQFRRRGIGKALIQACEQRLSGKNIRLSVRASNHEAIHLYECLGYEQVGIWPAYYIGGEDAVVMEKLGHAS